MIRIVNDSRVVEFVSQRLGRFYYPVTAVGLEKDGRIVAGAVYERFNGHNVYFHGASDGSKKWAVRGLLRAACEYPFLTLGAKRMTAQAPESNEAAVKFDLAFGFEEECRLKGAAHDGSDLISFVMWKDKCKWLSSG